jgi:hypothetical protein
MFVAHDLGLLFLHIPKTAGMSLRAGLKSISRDNHFDFPRMHIPAREFREIVGHNRWDKFYSFSIVRNPWEWTVSFYSFLKDSPEWLVLDKRWKDLTGDDWAYRFERLANGGLAYFLDEFDWSHYTPQTGMPIGKVGQLDWLNYPINRIYKIDELGELSSDILKLTGKRLYIPHMNSSPHVHYRDYYTEQTKRRVEQLNEKLIDQFEYTF